MKWTRALVAGVLLAFTAAGFVAPQAMATGRASMASIAQGELNKDPDSYRVAGTVCNMYSGYFGSGDACSHSGWRSVDWCADFVRYIWTKAGGVEDLGKLNSFAQSFEDYGRAERTWHDVGTYAPKPGDAVVYKDLGGQPGLDDHVGLVVSYSGGTLTTIEGNWGYKVAKRVNPIDIKGFAEPAGVGAGGVSLHDQNGDGRDDVVAITPGNPGIVMTSFHGSGSGTTPLLQWSGTGSTPSLAMDAAHYAVGDMNHDGKADVLYAAPQANGATHFGYWPSDGAGYKPSLNLGDSALISTTAQVLCGDINGDGYTDLVVITPDGAGTAITAWRGNGSTMVWSGTGGSPNLPYATARFALADYNRDGKDDVVWTSANADGTTKLGAFPSDGVNFKPSAVFGQSALNSSTSQLLAGDISGDSYDDIALITPNADGSTAITAYANTGSGFTWSGTGGSPNIQYTEVKATMSDANGDHRADVVYAFTPKDGGTQFAAWLSNGKGFGGAVFTVKSGLDSTAAQVF